MSYSIETNGWAKWTLHPLSYFGMYPFSYPSAVPFMLSEISLITGISGEYAILLASFLFGLLCSLFMFIFLHQASGDWRIGIAGAFFYSLSPSIVNLSWWSASTRNLFLVLLPLMLWAILKTYNERKKITHLLKNLMILVLIFIIFMSSHRLSIFIVPIIIAFITAHLLVKIDILRLSRSLSKHKHLFRYSMGFAIISVMGCIVVVQYTDFFDFYTNIRWEMIRNYGMQDSLMEYLYNHGKAYSQSIGIGIIFLPIGLFLVISKIRKNLMDIVLLLLFILSISILIVPTYATDYIIPTGVFFIGTGAIALFSRLWRFKKELAASVIVAFVLSTIIITPAVVNYWNQGTITIDHMEHEHHSTVVYIKNTDDDAGLISNRGEYANMLNAYGISTLSYEETLIPINSRVNIGDIELETTPIENILRGHIRLYSAKYKGYEKPSTAWSDCTLRYTDSKGDLVNIIYGVNLVIEDTSLSGKINHEGKLIDSTMLSYVYANNYKVYQMNDVALWHFR